MRLRRWWAVTMAGLLAAGVLVGSADETARALPAAVTSVSIPPPATGLDRADGSQYAQGPGHDGVARGSTLTAPLHLAWSKTLPGIASNAIIDSTGRMFVAAALATGGFNIYRLNRRTGAIIWGPVHVTGGINLSKASLALASGILVSYETEDRYSGRGSNARLHGLDANTGAVRWTTELPLQYIYDGFPLIWGGKVYVHSHDSRVGGVAWAVNLQTGKLHWGSVVQNAYASLGAAAAGSYVYYSGVGNQLYALNPATGALAFHSDSGYHGGGNSSIVYAKGRLYLNDFQGNQNNRQGGGRVVSATTGRGISATMRTTQRPAVDAANNVIVTLWKDQIVAKSLDGRTQYWAYPTSARPSISPVVANGLVITGDNSGRLLVLREATGAVAWSDSHAFPPTSLDLLQGTEPAMVVVGAGGLALTSGNQLRFYAGAINNGPTGG